MSTKSVFVVGDQGPSGYYRIILPCGALKEAGADANLAFAYEDFEAADILVFQRQHRGMAFDEILRWQKLGKKIVVDFDDNFLQLEPDNKANRVYTPEAIADLKRLISAADAVTAATAPLAEAFKEYSGSVHVIPNALPAHAFEIQARRAAHTIVGWQGSDSHHNDLKIIKSVIHGLQRRLDFEFVLAGYNPPGLFRQASFRPWITFSPELDYFQAFVDFTIGLCPLSKTPFNDCKSDLKWLEYSALSIPTVASAAKPYAEVEHNVTGLLARNLSDWEEQITRLLSDEDLRRRIGKAAREHVHKHRTIDQAVARWREVLDNLKPPEKELP